jgi:hypothetical protein
MGSVFMKHYDVAEWVDLARGLVSGDELVSMRGHLSEGCAECQDVASFFESLNAVRRQMETSVPPEWVVRSAKAIFPAHAKVDVQRAVRIPVRLIYDSLLAPEPAGLRATWQVGWQALYRAGDCSLDLRVEPELSSTRAAVIGQISNHQVPENQMENIPVYLKSGRAVVAETRSNRYGEFQIEYEQQGRLQLCVYLEDGSKCFQVPLRKFAADKPLGVERLGISPEAATPESES